MIKYNAIFNTNKTNNKYNPCISFLKIYKSLINISSSNPIPFVLLPFIFPISLKEKTFYVSTIRFEINSERLYYT